MQPFPLPTQRHKPLMPYSHGNPNFTPCKPKLDLPQNINNFTPQVVNNNNIPSFRSSPLIGQSNELSQEMQLCNSIGPNLSEDLYKHPLPRGNCCCCCCCCFLYMYIYIQHRLCNNEDTESHCWNSNSNRRLPWSCNPRYAKHWTAGLC